MAVLSALEMACSDIVGKEANQPVYKLLGGRVHERLRTYTYIYARPGEGDDVYNNPIYHDPDASAERAVEYLAEGFTGIKFDPAGAYSAFDPRQLSLEALDLCFLAMACQRLGKADEAARWLDQARNHMDRHLPKAGGDLGSSWWDVVMARVARRETEALFRDKPR